MKRTLLYLLMLTMVLFAFTACETNTSDGDQTPGAATNAATPNQTATSEPTENPLAYLNLDATMPVINDGYELALDVVAVQNSSYTATPEDHWVWAFFKQYCNLDLNVTYYQSESWQEQRNLIFTSGDLPDIFYLCGFSSNDMVRYGQVEGMLYPLETLIDYAPLMQAVIDENPSFLSESTTPDGHMYCIPKLNSVGNYILSTSRVFINQSWLDTLGLSMPGTLDDMLTVLTAFRDQDPNGNGQADEIPFLGFNGNAAVVVLTALGINQSDTKGLYAKDDGTVSIPVMEDNYIHYLEYMKQLLTDGLLDPDYYTMTSEQNNAKLSQKIVGLSYMGAPYVYMPEPEDYEQYKALVPMTSDYNSKQIWPIGSQLSQGTFAIGYDTEYPEACMRMANVFFIEEAPILFYLGPFKSDDYETGYLVDGWEYVTYTWENEAWKSNAPDGTSTWEYINNHVGISSGPVGRSSDSVLRDRLLGKEGGMTPHEAAWRDTFKANVVPYEQLILPTLFLEPDALERANELITPITDYIETMEAKFIMGSESLDAIDAFYDELDSLGIEEYLQIYQDAYNNYLANMK